MFGKVGSEHILQPTNNRHATLFRRRNHPGENVEVAVIGRMSIPENRVLVVLGARDGEVSSMKLEVVFLLAVIKQRSARNLPSSDPGRR